MGSIKNNIYGLSALFVLVGMWIYLFPHPKRIPRTEEWLKANTPYSFMSYRYIPSPKDPKESYKVDKNTYKILIPEAMLGRIYRKDNNTFDVTTLISESKESFHDPRICFSAQGWTVENYTPTQLKTKTRGNINASLVRVSSKTERNKLALFFYKVGKDTFGTPQSIKIGLVWNKLKGEENVEGVFYRFIPSTNTTQEDLIKFAIDYVDTINNLSKGIL